MKTLTQQLKEATAHIRLEDNERVLMREHLVDYMEHKPLTRKLPKKHASHQRASFPIFSYFRAHHLSGALIIALVATSGTFGVSLASTNALPGDFLYSVKVNFNEEIKTALLKSDKARINWERERAELRLEEAGQLAVKGRLDADTQEEVSRRFAEHTDAVVEQVLAVEESDPVLAAEVSSEFEEALDTHEAVLARLIVERQDDGDKDARDLVEQVHTAAVEAGKMRENVEEKLDVQIERETAIEEVVEEENGETTLAAQEEDTSSKMESAYLRERAAYRAQARAQEQLEVVQALLVEIGQDGELAEQAQAQIESGKDLMVSGAAAIAENDLSHSYSDYRRAAAAFQKVGQLLEVADLFAIEVLPDTLLAEEPVEESGEMSLTSEEEGVPVEAVVVTNTELAITLRDEAEFNIQAARKVLLTHEGYETDLVNKANALVKDAAANMLRGDIALVLGEIGNAEELFANAVKQASRVVEMLTIAADEWDITNVELLPEQPTNDVVDPVPVEEISAPESVEAELPETSSISLQHAYVEGVHTYRGAVTLPTPCTALEATAFVAESMPEQVSIQLNTREPEEGVMCAQVEDEQMFEVQFTASDHAQLVGLQMNGVAHEWLIERDGEEEAVSEGEGSAEAAADTREEEPGLLRRALETTQEFLLPD